MVDQPSRCRTTLPVRLTLDLDMPPADKPIRTVSSSILFPGRPVGPDKDPREDRHRGPNDRRTVFRILDDGNQGSRSESRKSDHSCGNLATPEQPLVSFRRSLMKFKFIFLQVLLLPPHVDLVRLLLLCHLQNLKRKTRMNLLKLFQLVG